MSTPDYPQILVRRYPGRPFTMQDVTDPATLIANDGGSVPTKDELDALWPSVEPEIEAEQTRPPAAGQAAEHRAGRAAAAARGAGRRRDRHPPGAAGGGQGEPRRDAHDQARRRQEPADASEAIAHGDAAGVLPGVARRELDHQPELGGQVRLHLHPGCEQHLLDPRVVEPYVRRHRLAGPQPDPALQRRVRRRLQHSARCARTS